MIDNDEVNIYKLDGFELIILILVVMTMMMITGER